MDRQHVLAWSACWGAVALLAGCLGGGAPGPPPPATKKAPPAPVAKAPAAPAKPPAGPTTALSPTPSSPSAPAAGPPPPPAYTYDARGRRDPFRPLVVARVAPPRPKTGLASLDPGNLKLTGVVWDQRGYYGLVEAPNGLGYVIRVNDLIGEEARVTKITPDGLTLEVETRAELPREKDQSRLLEIRLHKEEER